MKNTIAYIFLLLLGVAGGQASAQDNSYAQRLLDRTVSVLESMADYRADFVYTYPQASPQSGTMYARGDRYRVETDEFTLFSDGQYTYTVMDAEQIGYHEHGVVPVWRQEVYLPVILQGCVANGLKLFHGRSAGHACAAGHVGHAVNRTIPYDVVDVDVVADKSLGALVQVDYSYQPVAAETEIIQERRILAERVITV